MSCSKTMMMSLTTMMTMMTRSLSWMMSCCCWNLSLTMTRSLSWTMTMSLSWTRTCEYNVVSLRWVYEECMFELGMWGLLSF